MGGGITTVKICNMRVRVSFTILRDGSTAPFDFDSQPFFPLVDVPFG